MGGVFFEEVCLAGVVGPRIPWIAPPGGLEYMEFGPCHVVVFHHGSGDCLLWE